MIEALEIERMSRTEKVQAMELLWRSMSSTPVKSPAWHKTVLQKRLAKIESGKAEFLTNRTTQKAARQTQGVRRFEFLSRDLGCVRGRSISRKRR